jgi:hypothetical protein
MSAHFHYSPSGFWQYIDLEQIIHTFCGLIRCRRGCLFESSLTVPDVDNCMRDPVEPAALW